MINSEHTYGYSAEPPVEVPPTRVISLVPYATESLFELGVGDRLIGISERCTRPEGQVAGIARVGDVTAPDFEVIAEMRPDLIIADPFFNTHTVISRLRELGFPVWELSPATVLDAVDVLWQMMRLFEDTGMIHRVRAIQMALDWTMDSARASEPVRVFAPLWRDPWVTFSRDTFAHDLLRVCGGENVFADRVRAEGESLPADPLMAGLDRRYPVVSVGEIEAAQPDVILLPGEPYPFGEKDVRALAGLDVPAAQNGRIYLIEGELLTWPGTRLARALQVIPPLLR